jgi:hypothetical protein
MPELPSVEELKQLPLRAIVAYAARCAHRVQPPVESFGLTTWHKESLKHAILVAEEFARGVTTAAIVKTALDTAVAARRTIWDHPAADAACAAAEAAFITASYADAADAADAASLIVASIADSAQAQAARADFIHLLGLGLGLSQEFGQPIDPSESGPLGPLWPKGEPEWFRPPGEPPKIADAAPIKLYFDLAEFSDDEIVSILGRLSDLYRSIGGDVLVIEGTETLDPASVLTPVEA